MDFELTRRSPTAWVPETRRSARRGIHRDGQDDRDGVGQDLPPGWGPIGNHVHPMYPYKLPAGLRMPVSMSPCLRVYTEPVSLFSEEF